MRGAIPPTAQIKLLLTFKINTIMTKNYYRDEYTKQQWIALIDKAIEFGCKIEYSKYGNIAEINSTDLETILMKIFPHIIGKSRNIYAEHIHRMIQDAADRVK